jgi:uncharacterized SAM-binding protein YcdF (DUF218 family)
VLSRRVRRLAVALIVLAAAVAFWAWGAGRFLVVADPLPARADLIVVMAGSVADRAIEAADLYAQGRAPTVVLTRERLPPDLVALRERGADLPENDVLSARVLGELGVPEGAIVVLPERAISTVSEAQNIAALVCRDGIDSLIVVTSPWHTRRTRMILARVLPPSVRLTIRPAPAAAFPAAQWWSERWAAKHVLTEYEKLAHWWVLERWGMSPCTPAQPAAGR